ncbi:hypothetical protein ACX5HH_000538 [Providencia stuartii]|uniref:hypothetical protein n=1 Tax=Providencia stuartii TaxID=588 RepID=UPI00090C4F76|nr:hypothetical protein [Providencia stuartii]APG52564.1 hypothetical protein BGK56_17085 [Providencia stuartii]SUC43493.1 Uncharacterised protein [Providencia stuartii]
MNDYEDDFICKIESPSPEWVTFKIKTTMKDKFGSNATPNGGKLSEIRKDYIGNMKLHLDTSINSFLNDKNSYSLTIKEATLLKEINSS